MHYKTFMILATIGLCFSSLAVAEDGTTCEPPFELEDWYIGLPSDDDGNGKSDSIYEDELADGWTDPRYFYYADDCGLVFKAPVKGAKTTNTTYTRTELREMMRRGNTSHKTSEPGRNNWVLSSAAKRYRKKAGGVDGELEATLAVNHVTTTGAKNEVGRVIIGQIHAKDNEPVRIYYRKLPGHTNGSLYFAHEINTVKENIWTPLLGDRSDSADDPADGIPLNEKFSYKIVAFGDAVQVDIIRYDAQNQPVIVARKQLDISESGYDYKDEYMYFKAGVYNQNKSGDPDDYVQATFYELTNKHSRPK